MLYPKKVHMVQRFGLAVQTATVLAVVLTMFASNSCVANASAGKQEDVDKQQDADQLVTVRGQLQMDPSWKHKVDWSSFEASLIEQVKLLQPPFPESWPTMTQADRRKWMEDFRNSDAGRELVDTNQQLTKQRQTLIFTVEKDGRFSVYDVPRGNFVLHAEATVEQAGKIYRLQSEGFFGVGDVDEVDLSTMLVDVLRWLKIGEEAPDFMVETATADSIKLSSLRGKHLLLVFGQLSNPSFRAATDAMKELQESADVQGKLSLLMVSVDDDTDAVRKILRQEQIDFPCGLLGKWDRTLLSQYGLKSVPSFWLIDEQGKIVLTGSRFLREINRQKTTIQKLVEDVVTGRIAISEENGSED